MSDISGATGAPSALEEQLFAQIIASNPYFFEQGKADLHTFFAKDRIGKEKHRQRGMELNSFFRQCTDENMERYCVTGAADTERFRAFKTILADHYAQGMAIREHLFAQHNVANMECFLKGSPFHRIENLHHCAS